MAQNKKTLRIAAFDSAQAPFPVPVDFPRPLAPLIIAYDIANGLSQRGHDVTLFGPKGSRSDSFKTGELDFEPLYKNPICRLPDVRGIEQEKIASLFDQYAIMKIFEEHKRKPFDIIHIHPIDRVLPFLPFFPETPVVSTLHDPIYAWRKEIFRVFSTPNMHLVSISNAQRAPAPDLNFAATIYNGIHMKLFGYDEKGGDYLFFAGRLQENKGVFEAIQVAQRTGSKLLIAGSPAEGRYWDEKIKPYLNNQIQYVGLIPYEKLARYYQRAKALLFPILWEEPFGLTMVEAMACGTPVIAFRRGSVPEIIENGKTGFIVNSVEEMIEAVSRLDTIKRKDCREHVEKNFATERMVERYEEEFLKLVKR